MASSQITYTVGYQLVLSRICSNSCGYCEFPIAQKNHLPSKKIVLSRIQRAAENGATTVKLVSGERISEHPSILTNIKYYGFNRYFDYVKMVTESIISVNSSFFLFPILDLGVLSFTDLILYRDWIFSLRLALESSDNCLMSNLAHRLSPGKKLDVRTSSLISAGQAKIPTSTGILLGIGENQNSRFKSLEIISKIYEQFGHIQSVSINRFYPIAGTPMADKSTISNREFIYFIKCAKKILPPAIPIQIDINKEENLLPYLIEAGVTDLGEIEISDNNETPLEKRLESIYSKINGLNVELRERLPVFDDYIFKGWFPERFLPLIKGFYSTKLKKPELSPKINFCIVAKKNQFLQAS